MVGGGEAAFEGDGEGLEGGLPAHGLAGRVQRHERHVDAFEGGRLVREVPAGADGLAYPGDPHYFDLDTTASARLVAAIAELAERSEPSRPDLVRALLADYGVIADRLSATVLLYQVQAVGDGYERRPHQWR